MHFFFFFRYDLKDIFWLKKKLLLKFNKNQKKKKKKKKKKKYIYIYS